MPTGGGDANSSGGVTANAGGSSGGPVVFGFATTTSNSTPMACFGPISSPSLTASNVATSGSVTMTYRSPVLTTAVITGSPTYTVTVSPSHNNATPGKSPIDAIARSLTHEGSPNVAQSKEGDAAAFRGQWQRR